MNAIEAKAEPDGPHLYNSSGANKLVLQEGHTNALNTLQTGVISDLSHGPPVPDEDEDEDVTDRDMYSGQDGPANGDSAELDEVDRRSVFVGNVDYGSTPPELQEHFKNCGSINRITIMVDRYTGHPKGYAYIEFQEESAISNAVSLNDSIFRDRPLKVTPKRKNIPGVSVKGRGGLRGRGGTMSGLGARGSSTRARGGRGMRGTGFPGYFPRHRGRGQRATGPY